MTDNPDQNLLEVSEHKTIPRQVLLYIAWRNLASRKLRTFLTIFGVMIGIGAIFFLITLGLGLHNLVTQQVVGDKSIKVVDVSSPNSKILKLDNNLVNKIRALPHVTQVGSSYSFPATIEYKGGSVDAVSYGVNSAYENLDNLYPVQGRLLDASDTNSIVINKAAVKILGISSSKAAIGETISVNIPLTDLPTTKQSLTKDFKVVGVVDFDNNSEIFIPKSMLDVLQVPYYYQLKLSVDKDNYVAQVRRQIESLGYQTSSPVDTLNQINQIFRIFTLLLVGFGSIGMVVSILGMFNTLTISLLERTKEIGLMLAMGGRKDDMQRLFTYEAMLLSLFGSLLGELTSGVLSKTIEGFLNWFDHRRGITQAYHFFAYPAWAIIGCIVFMMLVGLMVVQFPARRAKKINPIDALRRE